MLLELTFQDITVPDDLAADLALLEQLLGGRIPSYSMEKRYVRKDGSEVCVNVTVSLVRTADGKPDYFVSVIEDIQRRKEAESSLAGERESRQRQLEQLVAERTEALQTAIQDLESLARRDALTELQNRLSANERLRLEFLRMKRTGRSYSALLMDIDYFKDINDTYGHETGDHVLKQVADVLQTSIRTTDFVARFGGEEFLVLLPETAEKGALLIAEKIRNAVAERPFPAARQVTISVGVSCARLQDSNEDEAVRRADTALYQAKEQGRNRVQSG
jgi:diguanylate cyclase (GGDEF)-like protein